jgi:hypothetical protein
MLFNQTGDCPLVALSSYPDWASAARLKTPNRTAELMKERRTIVQPPPLVRRITLIISCQSEIPSASRRQLADSLSQALRNTDFSAMMELSWFDDFDRGTHLTACFFLSRRPAWRTTMLVAFVSAPKGFVGSALSYVRMVSSSVFWTRNLIVTAAIAAAAIQHTASDNLN